MITAAVAIEALSFHSGRHDDVEHPRWRNGFLGSLRPYQGTLNKDAYHEVMAAIATLADHPLLLQNALHDLWGIVHLGRAWGVMEGGMLRSNNLVTAADVAKLDGWVSTIS